MGDQQAPPVLEWRVHLLTEVPWRGVVVILVLASVLLWVQQVAGMWMTIFAGLVLLMSLREFLLPTTYTLEGQRLTLTEAFGRRELDLSAFRRLEQRERRVNLFTTTTPGIRDRVRAVQLVLPRTNTDQILNRLQQAVHEREAET